MRSRSVAQGATYLGPQAAASLASKAAASRPVANDFGLTDREKEVLAAVSKGMTNREIAMQLSISVRTVESHRLSIREKTGAETPSRCRKSPAGLDFRVVRTRRSRPWPSADNCIKKTDRTFVLFARWRRVTRLC